MKRIRLAAAASTVALLITALPSAQAASVASKDLPSKGAFAKVLPEFSGIAFTTTSTADFAYPSATDCGYDDHVYGKSGQQRIGSAPLPGPLGGAHVVKLAKASEAKAVLAEVKRYVKRCPTYDDTVITTTMRGFKVPKVADQRVGYSTVDRSQMGTRYARWAILRDGKRVALVVVRSGSKVPAAKFRKLVKVAAKKMG